MKKLFLLLTLSVFSIGALAQSNDFLWAKQMGSTSIDEANSIVTDSYGNVYTTGSFTSTADFDPGSGVYNLTALGYRDIFISKIDANGNFIWAKQIGGANDEYSTSIAIDLFGNVLTIGTFRTTVDFDPGSGTYNLVQSGGAGDGFISKLDPSGNFIWAKQFSGDYQCYANSVKADVNGNVYTVGSFGGIYDFDPGANQFILNTGVQTNIDIFISKLDAQGNFIWAKKIGGGADDRAESISIDLNGNIYTAGYFHATVDFDPGAGTYNLVAGAGTYNAFILKLNSSGIFIWAKQFEGASIIFEVENDLQGNIISTGEFGSITDFDPGLGIYNLTSSDNDAFISKLDSLGNFVWAKQIGSSGNDHGNSISTDSMGNIYTAGAFSGTADFDPGFGNYNMITTGGLDIFILKLESNGNFIWAKKLGSDSDDDCKSIEIDNSGNVYTTGYFQSLSDFDPEVSVYYLTSNGDKDIFIHKLSPCGPATISSASTLICGNITIDITATAGSSYQWYKNGVLIGGANSQIYSASASGSYTCVVGLSCGTNTSNSIQITKYNLPSVTLTTSGPTTFCNGDSVIISASSNAGGFATWQWYKDNVVISGATNNSYKATTAGTYKCTVTNSSTTCSRISTGVVVSILTTTANITAGSSTTFCIGGNVLLTAVTNAGAGSTYQWYLNSNIIGGATNATYTASTTGNYSFTVNNSNGCSATSTITPVTVNPLPGVTITPSGSTIICPSGTLSLTASAGTSYLWSTAATTQTIIVSTAGNYSVTVTNANGCSAASTPISVSLSACEIPTNIAVSSITGTKATINWTGNNCAVKYRVRIRALGTTTWSTLIVNAPTTTKNITGLQPLTTYEYQVRTDCNSAGTSYSAYSTIQTFTTICDCTKPTNIAVSNVTQTGATVSWLGNSCAVKYRLQYRIQGTTTWTTKSITAPIVTKTLTLLTPNTIYEYRLRSDCNSTGTINSGYTTIATITTIPRFEDTEIESSLFYVTPNPCSTCFVSGLMEEKDLMVTDIVGRKVNVQFTKSEYGFYINMPDASKGLYLIRNNKTGEVVKFVRE